MGIADGIGDFMSSIFGSKNKYQQPVPQVDPNAYQYGGQPGGADEAANRYRQQAEGAQGRQGEQVNYGDAQADRSANAQARMGMQGMADQMAMRARGQLPSIAQMQADRQMQQASAAQSSAAASARGPAAMALAQQNAAANTANAQSAISGQAQINAANERMQAEQGALGAYGAMRGGDQGNQQMDAQQAQYQSQLNQQQRGQNDAYDIAKSNQEMGVRNAQLTAGMNQQAQQSSNALGSGQINAGVSGQNSAINQQNGMGVLGAGASVAGSALQGKAKGGPVAGRQPYLVGEQGPELIVPKHDGTVIPAGPTQMLLAMMQGRARVEGGDVEGGGAASTWGTGGPDTAAQQAAAGAAANMNSVSDPDNARYARLATSGGLAVPGFTPGMPMSRAEPLERQDADLVRMARAREAEGSELTEDEARRVKGAEFRMGQTQANAKAAAKAAPPPAEQKKSKLGDMLSQFGSASQKQAGGIDIGYHGGGQLAGPHLLALPGRAMGGPVEAGGAPAGGGIDIGDAGKGISGAQILAASTGTQGNYSGKELGEVGGGGITGGNNIPTGGGQIASTPVQRAASALGSWARGAAGSVDTGYHPFPAREEGGPVKAGGEPDVLPLYEPPGKQLHQSLDGHGHLVDEPKTDTTSPLAGGPLLGGARSSPAATASARPAPKPAPPRKMTPEEMMRAANALEAQLKATHEARMAQGPAVSPTPVDGGAPAARTRVPPMLAPRRTSVEIGPAQLDEPTTWEVGPAEVEKPYDVEIGASEREPPPALPYHLLFPRYRR